jgi:hypothetical protein
MASGKGIDVEPSVIVEPTLAPFCVVRTRIARGTRPPRAETSGRLPLSMIQQYLRENTDDQPSEE